MPDSPWPTKYKVCVNDPQSSSSQSIHAQVDNQHKDLSTEKRGPDNQSAVVIHEYPEHSASPEASQTSRSSKFSTEDKLPKFVPQLNDSPMVGDNDQDKHNILAKDYF